MKTCPAHHKKITHTCGVCKTPCCNDCGKICKGCITKIGVVILVVMCTITGIIYFGLL